MQKPHCSPWHSANACCTGRARRPASASPSTVVISCPSTVTANIRQERTGRRRRSTVQAPHTPCSQPTWVPVSPRSWRRRRTAAAAPAPARRAVTPFTIRRDRRAAASAHRSAPLRDRRVRAPPRRACSGRARSARRPAGGGRRRSRGCRRPGRPVRQRRRRGQSTRRGRTAVERLGQVDDAPGRRADRDVADPGRDDPQVVVERDQRADPAQRVVAVPPGDLARRPCPRRGGSAGKNARRRARRAGATTPAARRRGRRRRSSRVPRRTRQPTEPPSRVSTTGISAAASACTRLPTDGAPVADRRVGD